MLSMHSTTICLFTFVATTRMILKVNHHLHIWARSIKVVCKFGIRSLPSLCGNLKLYSTLPISSGLPCTCLFLHLSSLQLQLFFSESMFLLWVFFCQQNSPPPCTIVCSLFDIIGGVFVIHQPYFLHITNFFKSLKDRVEPILQEIQVSPDVHCRNTYIFKTYFNFLLLSIILV